MSMRVLLGSSSPRRRQLLTAAGCAVTIVAPAVDETYPEHGVTPEEGVMLLAERKYAAVRAREPAHADMQALVTADTLVFLGHTPLGKPADAAEAAAMLAQLSGKTHLVVTGYVVDSAKGHYRQAVTTLVRMRTLDPETIAAYVATQEPFGRAGSYSIQDAGGALVDSIYGSYTNVVGLPVAEVLATLAVCV